MVRAKNVNNYVKGSVRSMDDITQWLAPGGAFVSKVLQGGTEGALLALLKRHFAKVQHFKPPASRKDSAEMFVVATGFRGDGD